MNLRHRTRSTAFIFRPAPIRDALGSLQEAFSAPHLTVQGHFLPDSGSLKKGTEGLHAKQTLRLLLPPGTDIRPGDGVGQSPDTAEYRVTRCDSFPLHLCVHLEAIAP